MHITGKVNMTQTVVGEQKKIRAKNPWYPDMSDKEFYFRDPQDWVGDASQLSGPQKKVGEALAAVARESIKPENFPADGTFATLKNRMQWIGENPRLKDEVFTTRARLEKRKPKSATSEHPIMKKLQKVTA